jgi:L-amino acid N-acyltransferase YncA
VRRSPSRLSADAETAVREVRRRSDLPALLDIYNHVVKTSHATFELVTQTLLQRKKWLWEHRGRYPIIIAETRGRVVGYAIISKFRERPAYSKTGESSVYVHPDFQGKGVGTLLMKETVARARELGYHTIIAGIALPNEASVRLHEGWASSSLATSEK